MADETITLREVRRRIEVMRDSWKELGGVHENKAYACNYLLDYTFQDGTGVKPGFNSPKTENPSVKNSVGKEEVPEGKYLLEPFWTGPGYRGEYQCPHDVGHGNHIHGCDGCCDRDDFPLNAANIEATRATEEDGSRKVVRYTTPGGGSQF
jgi:hypothetical protein